MNPQPDMIATITSTMMFLCVCIYFFMDKKNHYNLKDDFIIAEYKTQVITNPKPKNKKIIKKQTPKQSKPKKQKVDKNIKSKEKKANEYSPLQQDCFDALIALGMSKKESKFVVNHTFNHRNPKTIQEFLSIALIK